MTGSLVGLLLGMAMGARHALEPDHLAAVSVLAADQPGARRGAMLGALWGIGHAAALLGTGLVLAAVAAELPAALADAFELSVAAMLILLGARAVHRAVLRTASDGPMLMHAHAGSSHRHAGPPAHVHVASRTLALRPLAVGVVHGLAGSGALTALVLARLPSAQLRLVYTALFCVGSIIGMCVLSGLAGWPLARIARNPRAARLLLGTAGAVSATLGLIWGWPIAGRLL